LQEILFAKDDVGVRSCAFLCMRIEKVLSTALAATSQLVKAYWSSRHNLVAH